MRTKQLAGSQIVWVAQTRQYIEGEEQVRAFHRRKEAVHFIDHRVEGWDGWRLLACSAYQEVLP